MNPVVYNATPYRQQGLLLADAEGQLVYTVVVSATFEFDEAGNAVLAASQSMIPVADECFGKPGVSSLRRDSVAYPSKPRVDFVVEAEAHAPGGTPVGQLMAGVRIGDWSKVVSVSGDRQWAGPLRNRPSSPLPFLRMPVRYERAFGGSLRTTDGGVADSFRQNPVGVGFSGAASQDDSVETRVPNVESPDDRLRQQGGQCKVAGFGAIARHWLPRAGFCGTYDKAWLERRSPVLPVDFDARFHQSAPTDQQFSSDLAGEWLLLRNLTPEGHWKCRIPSLTAELTLIREQGADRRRVQVDTIVVDANAKTMTLIARHCVDGLRRLGTVREIVLGEVSGAWMRSRLQRKRYLGRSAPVPSA